MPDNKNTPSISFDEKGCLNIVGTSIFKGSLLLRPKAGSTGALDLVDARINISIKEGARIIKTYTVGDGLEAVNGDSLRWTIDAEADGFKASNELHIDGYIANIDTKRRSFSGTIKVTKLAEWN